MKAVQCILAVVFGFAVAGFARAEGTPLAPGTFGPPLSSGFGGTALLDSGSNTFSSGAGIAGTLFWQVWSDSPNSVLVGNEFAYRFTLTGSDSVHRMTINNWDGALTNVATSPFDAGTPATSADRNPSGNTIGFDFASSVLPGGESSWLVVFTDGTTISPATASFIDGSSVSIGTVSLVPEPDPYAMIMAGVGLLGFIARRRRGYRRARAG